jgi:hypothetical protein
MKTLSHPSHHFPLLVRLIASVFPTAAAEKAAEVQLHLDAAQVRHTTGE